MMVQSRAGMRTRRCSSTDVARRTKEDAASNKGPTMERRWKDGRQTKTMQQTRDDGVSQPEIQITAPRSQPLSRSYQRLGRVVITGCVPFVCWEHIARPCTVFG